MNNYIMNLVKVFPDKGTIEVYKITGKTNLGLLAGIINRYSKGLVASFLSTDYGELEAGVYVAGIGDYSLSKEDVEARVDDFLDRYKNERTSQGLSVDEPLNSNNIIVEPTSISSTTYVVANLLSNYINKTVPKELQCPRRPGERFAVCLDIDFLEGEFWNQKVGLNKDKRFVHFCNDYPGLCRDTGDSCSKFFRVVKCITMRFQHVVSDREEIYLVLHQYYRRLSNLGLKIVVDYIRSSNIDFNALLGIYVNYRINKNSTWICKIVSISNNDVVLECEGKSMHVHLSELDNISISVNPTYSQSRRFIGMYLCKDFDKHKDLNRLYPSQYFSILENDLEIVRRIVGKLCIGGVCFSIDRELKRVW